MTANIKETEDGISITRYDTPEKMMSVIWRIPVDELKECNMGGVDADGNEHNLSFGEYMGTIKEMGCYGFAGNNQDIHIWIGENAEPGEVIKLLAHERGHLMRPRHRDDTQEEMKAERYALCADFAYSLMCDLFEKRGK